MGLEAGVAMNAVRRAQSGVRDVPTPSQADGDGWAVFVDAHLVADLFVVGGEVPPEGDVGIGHRARSKVRRSKY